MGQLFSTFCWHVEDNFMFSINYSHVGEGKFWYFANHQEKKKFEVAAKKVFPEIFEKNPNILHNVTLQINPLDLIKHNVIIS